MSIQAIAYVLEHSESRGLPRLVLLAIANHADAFGMNAYPSIGKIAQEARVHRATVYRSLAALEQSGELEILCDGEVLQYRLVMKKVSQRATKTVSHAATDRRTVRKQASRTQPFIRAREDLTAPLPLEVRARGTPRVADVKAVRTGGAG